MYAGRSTYALKVVISQPLQKMSHLYELNEYYLESTAVCIHILARFSRVVGVCLSSNDNDLIHFLMYNTYITLLSDRN